MIRTCGKGPFTALINDGSKLLAGNSLMTSHPCSYAVTISWIVKQPGKYGTAYLLHTLLISSLKCGLTINVAPCNNALRAVSASKTVPAPMIASVFVSDSITSLAFVVVYVTSLALKPPLIAASDMAIASSLFCPRTTATIFEFCKYCNVSNFGNIFILLNHMNVFLKNLIINAL